MLDELELEDDVEVVDSSTSAGETVSTDLQTPSRQPQQQKVNLDELPEFRQWKSQTDSRVSRAEYEAQQARQQAANLKNQYDQILMQNMTVEQQLQYQNQQLLQQLQDVDQQRRQDAIAAQWRLDMQDISNQTGYPVEELLQQGLNSYESWKVANKWVREQQGKKPASEQGVDDRVEVSGGGKPLSQAQRYQREYEKALELADWRGMENARDKAARAGVTIVDRKLGREMS